MLYDTNFSEESKWHYFAVGSLLLKKSGPYQVIGKLNISGSVVEEAHDNIERTF